MKTHALLAEQIKENEEGNYLNKLLARYRSDLDRLLGKKSKKGKEISEENQLYINTLTKFLAEQIKNKEKSSFPDRLLARYRKDLDRLLGKKSKKEKEIYVLRESSEENQQYINTLTTFLALRHAFHKNKDDFKISVNNEKWNHFGNVVFEIVTRDETKIIAIRCKKIETTNNYTTVALSAESGKLSLKEQCEILKKLRESEEYQNASFKLHTVSSVAIDPNPKLTYDDETVATWKESKELWKGREIKIKPRSVKKKDLFNTTDDSDDVCTFELVNNEDEDFKKDLKKFRMYINQKKKTDLEILISNMIEDKFDVTANISGDLVKYVRKYFKTDKVLKKNETSFKMTKEDILLKVAELLLAPFAIFPNHTIKEEDLKLWNSTIEEFDVVIMKSDSDTMEKVYRAITCVVKAETSYSTNIFNYVSIDKTKVKNEKLRSRIFEDYGNDGSLQFLYLASWKSGLTPLVLEAEDEKQLSMILKVISVFKREHFSLKFIISTNCKLDRSYFPRLLKVFLNLADVKFANGDLLEKILVEKIKFLDFEVSLKDIYGGDFLEMLTPDALLNAFFNDYSFKDIHLPMTAEIVDNTLVLEDKFMEKMRDYFQRRESVSETGLSYLVNVNGQPTKIQVPPRL